MDGDELLYLRLASLSASHDKHMERIDENSYDKVDLTTDKSGDSGIR